MNHDHEGHPAEEPLLPEKLPEQPSTPPERQDGEDGFTAVFEPDPRGGLYLKVHADSPPDEIQAGLKRGSELFRKHGQPFKAFLLLPDIIATDPNLEALFLETYVGEFGSYDEIIDQWIIVHDWKTALHEFAAQYGMEEFVTIDRELLRQRINEVWDIIRLGDRLYAFNK